MTPKVENGDHNYDKKFSFRNVKIVRISDVVVMLNDKQ